MKIVSILENSIRVVRNRLFCLSRFCEHKDGDGDDHDDADVVIGKHGCCYCCCLVLLRLYFSYSGNYGCYTIFESPSRPLSQLV